MASAASPATPTRMPPCTWARRWARRTTTRTRASSPTPTARSSPRCRSASTPGRRSPPCCPTPSTCTAARTPARPSPAAPRSRCATPARISSPRPTAPTASAARMIPSSMPRGTALVTLIAPFKGGDCWVGWDLECAVAFARVFVVYLSIYGQRRL
ncbi:hypothetical protein BO99DRAFT_129727 [Aspergillus violaceofuscus CBS 115571]|uniref:Uncharacterized protein n=1 Tax=Aspergillus violaceofuscus (strain CBS 115571) TaxID=1450538 RepID=A0A2V5HNN7_ASPV1|nr:hypothetical protein BO99DRAFT_129727 [Aspergillus violaceofuscus CBS 115571]